MDEPGNRSRKYFTVVDESGRAIPAVEYWAGSFDHEEPVFQVVPLRKFVKLIGTGESLKDEGEGVFKHARTGRRFFRLQTRMA